MANKIKHNKIKNTGILFELLTRRLTSDIITGVENSIAQKLIEKYFNNNTELGKEYILYQALMKHKFTEKEKAEDFLNEVINAHKNLKSNEIKKSKYILVKEINDNFDSEDFFKPKIEDYKILASIYKTFQAKSLNESVNPSDIVDSKFTILEHIIQTPAEAKSDSDDLIKEYEKQDVDIRMLTYKLLVEKFNEKYSVLDESQKSLIKEYINNLSGVNSLNKYISTEIPKIQKTLIEQTKKIDSEVVKIKISEVCNQLEIMRKSKAHDDNHVMTLLNSYELVKELSELEKK